MSLANRNAGFCQQRLSIIARALTGCNLRGGAALREYSTIGVMIFCTAWIRLVLFTGSGFYAQPGQLPLAFALLPCAVVGHLLGSRLHARLSSARAVQAVWALLIVGGASLLLRALAMR